MFWKEAVNSLVPQGELHRIVPQFVVGTLGEGKNITYIFPWDRIFSNQGAEEG